MTQLNQTETGRTISVIMPTIGRPESLRRMLGSLCDQTAPVDEVVVADGSATAETEALIDDPVWRSRGLRVVRVGVNPPNAVRQRQAAIQIAKGSLLLLLDDDVVLEPDCVAQMVATLDSQPGVVGVLANFSNQQWPMPTRAWCAYLRLVHGLSDGAWNGRVIGPLLRFGYSPVPAEPQPMEWISTCNTLIRRSSYEACGGFSTFFLHRCTMNEDIDLGLKLARFGRILFCPAARMAHYHAPGGRVSPTVAAEDDLYNRFLVLRCTQGRSSPVAFGLVLLFFVIETASNLLGCMRRLNFNGFFARLSGRTRAVALIVIKGSRSAAAAQ